MDIKLKNDIAVTDIKPMVNLFIVGAPKCGTTSMCHYLAQHQNICMADIKEPHFFAHEFEMYQSVIKDVEAYHNLFSTDSGEEDIFAEGSVYYLYGKNTICKIREYNPEAKIIVMLRNPVDMAQSMHSQLVFTGDESEKSFIKAWGLQGSRAKGLNIPAKCREAKFLQYGDLCKLGGQVLRLLNIFPRQQIHFIHYDDFRSNAELCYRRVLQFLEIDEYKGVYFEIINANKRHKNEILAKFTERPPVQLVRLSTRIKKIFGLRRLGIMDVIRRVSTEKFSRSKLEESDERTLKQYFKEDVKVLSDLVGRDLLVEWKLNE